MMKWKMLLCALFALPWARAQYDFEEKYVLDLAPGAEELRYFACDSTDFLVLKCKALNKASFDEFSFIRYQADTVGISTQSAKAHHRLDIVQRGVYVLKIRNGATAEQFEIYLHHQGENSATKKAGVQWLEHHDTTWFEPEHSWVDTVSYKAKTVHKPQHFFLNSVGNVLGRTRVTLPVNLPENTERWYYTYSAYREEEEAQRISKTLDLAGQVAGYLIGTEGKLIGQAAALLTAPAGGEQCDVYLLGEEQLQAFLDKDDFKYKPEGSRENYTSGTVEIEKQKGKLHLGFRNNSLLYGIHVVVEVVAITRERERVKRTKPRFEVKTRKTPGLIAE
jgi:hypothetical protein